jgi:F0F1-type ATP synthase assembly protein I
MEDNSTKPAPESPPKFRKIAEAADGLSLGISIVVAVLIGVGLGIGMKKLFGYEWLFWLGVIWGLGAAFLNIYKVYKKQQREFEELANDPKYKNYPQQTDEDEDEKY